MTRRSLIKTTERSLRIAKLFELKILSDFILEDLDCEDIDTYLSRDLDKASLIPYMCREKASESYLADILDSLDLYHWNTSNTKLLYSEKSGSSISFLEKINRDHILDLVAEEIIRDYRENFSSYTLETYMRGVEYLFLLRESGEWIVLEGERFRVEAPRLEDVIASIHTHPGSSCIPSREDLETAIDLLSNKGVLAGISSCRCLFILRSRDPIDEETYSQLMHYLNNYDDFLDFLSNLASSSATINNKVILEIRSGVC